ncbi:hypothetical protein HF086_003102, partial [Spodoptera exigua]
MVFVRNYKLLNISVWVCIVPVINCIEQIEPGYVLSGDEEEDSNKPDEFDCHLRHRHHIPEPESVEPAHYYSSLLTSLPIHSPSSPPLQQETTLELDPILLFSWLYCLKRYDLFYLLLKASTINLMAFVITKLRNASEELSIEEYIRKNANLEAQIASCLERLGPEYDLSGGEDDVEPDDSNWFYVSICSLQNESSEETVGDDKRLRPGEKRMPVDWASTADLADARPSSSPNTLQTTTDEELAPSPLLPLDTMSEQDIALLFLTPPSPLLPPPSPSESTSLQLEVVAEENISLPY